MPRIIDNQSLKLVSVLRGTLDNAQRADFCVGYFNLRGWRQIDDMIADWAGTDDSCCRLLVGMQDTPRDLLRRELRIGGSENGVDQSIVVRLKRDAAQEFREQLGSGAPSAEDEAGLRRLSEHLRAGKLRVRLHLRYPLHAKLYLVERVDFSAPLVGFVGSSNLTMAGLATQGELNVDVLEQDAAQKLQRWFNERWNDRWCLDISQDLADIIDESWAGLREIPPYHIYLKMAYHLSQEARSGLTEFRIPREFGDLLFDFQVDAVKIAARYLNRRGGVMIGDVVGLGKTLMATALAKVFEEDHDGLSTLIICPANLVKMWEDHRLRYGLRAKVMSLASAQNELETIPPGFRLVLVDESHNLRNREGVRYRAIQEYISKVGGWCIMLSATPYNKNFLDLAGQLRLFVPEHDDIGIRPDAYIRAIGELAFNAKHQAPQRSLAAFEHSPFADDWRELMRLYLVRRTRANIKQTYAEFDPIAGKHYLTYSDGRRAYFPDRVPKTLKFDIDENDPHDQYARLFTEEIVDTINHLFLPRYGLGNYAQPDPTNPPKPSENEILNDLGRAGPRLMGFTRTNLFKRLESGGAAFLQSVDRHILRNYVYLHAIEHGLELPIGTQEPALLDPAVEDEDLDAANEDAAAGDERLRSDDSVAGQTMTEREYQSRADAIYGEYAGRYRRRFKWLRSGLFRADLRTHLLADAHALLAIRNAAWPWNPTRDAKLERLVELVTSAHPDEKVLVFTQFADTVRYLTAELQRRGIADVEGVTGDSGNPTEIAWRFSPTSNRQHSPRAPHDEIRVLVATDVLSEGQNLQDCHVVVSYDLPWAIIRLIQRAGRVDRIGQEAPEIRCYSFMPAEGIEQIIRLRARVIQRLRENAEVIGTDEAFFEDGSDVQRITDLYSEKAGVLDDEDEDDTDLSSYAYGIWKTAIEADPSLVQAVERLENSVYSTRAHNTTHDAPEGALVYLRTAQDNDALAWVDTHGRIASQSVRRILDAAACGPHTPAIERRDNHHELVRTGIEHLLTEEKTPGGQLGRPSGARYKTYSRLKRYVTENARTLFVTDELTRAVDEIYRYPLTQHATDRINRQIRAGIADQQLAELVVSLRDEDRLCVIHEDGEDAREPRIICSLGLRVGL